MHHNQSIIKRFLALTALAALLWAAPAAAQDEVTVLRYSSGPAVSLDFAISRGMSTTWSMALAGSNFLQVMAEVSSGSEENVARLRLGKADLAVLESLIARTASSGEGLYAGSPFRELRSMFRLWPNVEHFIIAGQYAKSGTPTDFKGLTVSAGNPGSGEISALVLLSAMGMNPSQLDLRYMTPYKAYRGFMAGNLNGVCLSDGPYSHPVLYILQSQEQNPRFLQITDEQLAHINANTNYKGFRFVIRADRYPNQKEPINTIAQHNHLYCRSDLDAETVYLLTKVFFDKFGQWGVGDWGQEGLEDPKKALVGLEVPLHPGAYRYFKEIGLKIPEHLIPPEMGKPAAAPAPAETTPGEQGEPAQSEAR